MFGCVGVVVVVVVGVVVVVVVSVVVVVVVGVVHQEKADFTLGCPGMS